MNNELTSQPSSICGDDSEEVDCYIVVGVVSVSWASNNHQSTFRGSGCFDEYYSAKHHVDVEAIRSSFSMLPLISYIPSSPSRASFASYLLILACNWQCGVIEGTYDRFINGFIAMHQC
eukprot:scaffold22276_cov22-Cyclotella_meneghiniana.AAC.1